MRIILILILAGACVFLLYDRSQLKDQLAAATDKVTATQSALEQAKKETANALAMLNAPKAVVAVAPPPPQPVAPTPKPKTWLQERIERDADALSRPPTLTSPGPAVRTPSSYITPYPGTNTYPYQR